MTVNSTIHSRATIEHNNVQCWHVAWLLHTVLTCGIRPLDTPLVSFCYLVFFMSLWHDSHDNYYFFGLSVHIAHLRAHPYLLNVISRMVQNICYRYGAHVWMDLKMNELDFAGQGQRLKTEVTVTFIIPFHGCWKFSKFVNLKKEFQRPLNLNENRNK